LILNSEDGFGPSKNLEKYVILKLMVEAAKKQNIFFQWLFWHFWEMPRNIFETWKNFLRFNLNYFSIHLLIKTLFSPWRKYSWAYPRGFDLGKYFEVFFSNLISRILGAVFRIFLIFLGILAEIFTIFAGLLILVGWLVLPALLIFGLIFSLKIVLLL